MTALLFNKTALPRNPSVKRMHVAWVLDQIAKLDEVTG